LPPPFSFWPSEDSAQPVSRLSYFIVSFRPSLCLLLTYYLPQIALRLTGFCSHDHLPLSLFALFILYSFSLFPPASSLFLNTQALNLPLTFPCPRNFTLFSIVPVVDLRNSFFFFYSPLSHSLLPSILLFLILPTCFHDLPLAERLSLPSSFSL